MGHTIRDVAREAAVSVASVSRVLNGTATVSPETRARIVAVADRLGYVPHAGARSLSLSRTHAVGVVLPDLHGEFFSELVRGMDREASRRGLQLLLSSMHDDIEQASHALRAMRGRVDGLVIMAPHLEAAALVRALPRTTPAVLINCRGDAEGHEALRLDNAAGVEAMVRHLTQTGRRHIVHIGGPAGNLDAEERATAFSAAMARLAPGGTATIVPGDFSEEAGEAAAKHILAEGAPVDAIFAANDMMAIGCLLALREAGIDVPGRIAVAGFDDVPVARYLALTTMRVRMAEIGAQAIARLAGSMERRPTAASVALHTPELIVRGTTALPMKQTETSGERNT
jgi:LacI family transcriptional regulator